MFVLCARVTGAAETWSCIAAYVLLLVATIYLAHALHGMFPYPDSICSWAAVTVEFIAYIQGILMLPLYITVIISILSKVINMILNIAWSFYFALANLQYRMRLCALHLHCKAATKRDELTPTTARVMRDLHYQMSYRDRFMQLYAKNRGNLAKLSEVITPDLISHQRLGLFYSQHFSLPEPKGFTRHNINLNLAKIFALMSTRLPQLHDSALEYLAKAVEYRWLSTNHKSKSSSSELGILKALSNSSAFLNDNHYKDLLGMWENGTTSEQLAQIRSEIHPAPEEFWMSKEEHEERQWAEALLVNLKQ
jgi:hypothetical protein